MAKAQQEKELIKTLRDSGIRKQVARELGAAAANNGGRQNKLVTDAAKELRSAATKLETRSGAASRSQSAKQAARTRKRKTEERGAAARKAARTRRRRAH